MRQAGCQPELSPEVYNFKAVKSECRVVKRTLDSPSKDPGDLRGWAGRLINAKEHEGILRSTEMFNISIMIGVTQV